MKISPLLASAPLFGVLFCLATCAAASGLEASSPSELAALKAGIGVQGETEAYMRLLSAEQRERSDAYFEGGYWLLLWTELVTVAAAWFLLHSRLSAAMRNIAARATRRTWLQTLIYAAQYFPVVALMMLPWAYYTGHVREHQYSLSTQPLADWIAAWGMNLGVTLISGSVLVVAVYALIRRCPRTWWLWSAGVSISLLVLLATVFPLFVAPLFNTYEPLPDSPLKADILAMARDHGVSVEDVYRFDASRQSNRISANVSGLLGTTRISLNDNLLERTSPDVVRAVLGHEIGHYVLGHTYRRMALFAVLIVAAFAFVRWGFRAVPAPWLTRWDLRGPADIAGLPLAVALLSVFMFLVTPLTNTASRWAEREADAFGLNAAREPDGFARAALLLAEYRKMRPGPVEEALFHDHPSGWKRIQQAMAWKARHQGHPASAPTVPVPPPTPPPAR
jgi:STE24 endopeptidase